MERYHPGVITLYFAAMLVFTAWFQQPVFLVLSLFTALVVSKATLGGQWGRRLGWSLLLGAIIGIWWAVFARFGDTILIDNLLGNPLTLEGLVYSATLWVRVTAVVLWWESLLRLVPAERLLTLTGRCSRTCPYMALCCSDFSPSSVASAKASKRHEQASALLNPGGKRPDGRA